MEEAAAGQGAPQHRHCVQNADGPSVRARAVALQPSYAWTGRDHDASTVLLNANARAE
jgi:hypothetical protein